jgi:cobalt/nickel transport system permease protein
MHIPDAVLAPGVAATTGVLAIGGLGFALRRLERALAEKTTVLMGITSAFVFAAQMVNFPIAPGVSGHLLGGVLAAVVLGPWAGAGVIATVLIVQAFLFGDGGVTALGANFVNMGLIGSVVGYAIYAPIRRAIAGRAGVLVGAMAAAWFSVILASAALAVELAASGRGSDFPRILGWLTLVHAAIGLGEAVITGMVLRFVLQTRPDLIYVGDGLELSGRKRWGQVAVAGLAIALAVVVFLAPFASSAPDGLEWVGAKLGFVKEGSPSLVRAPLPDYEMPGIPQARVATAVAGVIGTLLVFGVGIGLARAFPRPRPGENGGEINCGATSGPTGLAAAE